MNDAAHLARTGPWAAIDRAAMAHNLAWLRKRLPRPPAGITRLWAVVKADAYGHGLKLALDALQEADGFSVTSLEDVHRLRRWGWNGPVLLLSACGLRPGDLQGAGAQTLHVVIDEASQLGPVEAAAPSGLHVWLRYAGRLGSLGLDAGHYRQAFARLLALQSRGLIASAGHLHHYACAEEPEVLQEERAEFEALLAGLPGPRCTGNSAALCGTQPEPLHPGGHWLRCGLLLYGASALPGLTGAQLGLRPAMHVHARIVAMQRVRAGQTIGYGGSFVAARDTCVATVNMGYSHGLPRRLWEAGRVLVGKAGRAVPLAGRVAMDCFTVDLGPDATEQVGDLVTLWGRSPGGTVLPVETVADGCGTIAAELFTGLTARVPLLAL